MGVEIEFLFKWCIYEVDKGGKKKKMKYMVDRIDVLECFMKDIFKKKMKGSVLDLKFVFVL